MIAKEKKIVYYPSDVQHIFSFFNLDILSLPFFIFYEL